MRSLHDMQQAFVSAMLAGDAAAIAPHIVTNGIAPELRIQIYRNNAREGFTAALALTFPVIQRLGGDEWFRQTAWQYQQRHPSRGGDLQYAGERFAGFLTDSLRATPYEYFADVARLEWAYQEVLIAAQSAPLDLQRLGEIAPDDYHDMRLQLRPDVRCVESRFPILAIWKNNHANDGESRIELDAGPSRVLLVRREDHVELHEIDAAETQLIQGIATDATLGVLIAHWNERCGVADFGVTLLKLAQHQVFADFSVDHSASITTNTENRS